MDCKSKCGKCFGEIDDADGVSIIPCNHVFHHNCLNNAFEMMSVCQRCGDEGMYIYRYTYSHFVEEVEEKIKKCMNYRYSEEKKAKMFLKIIDEIIIYLDDLEIVGLDILRLMIIGKIDEEIRRKRLKAFLKLKLDIEELKKRRDIISRLGLYIIEESEEEVISNPHLELKLP
jgi:zinc-RING finger domain